MLRVQGTDKQKKGLHHRVYLAILLKLENKIALWITKAILCLNSSYIFELRQSGSQKLWLKLSLSLYMFELWQFIGSQKIKPFLAV